METTSGPLAAKLAVQRGGGLRGGFKLVMLVDRVCCWCVNAAFRNRTYLNNPSLTKTLPLRCRLEASYCSLCGRADSRLAATKGSLY